MPVLFADTDTVNVRAYFLGQKIELSSFAQSPPLAVEPLIIQRKQDNCVVLFDYGVAVLFGPSAIEEPSFLNDIHEFVVEPFSKPETEDVVLQIAPVNEGKVEDGVVLLSQFDIPILQLVADVLAKSVVLAKYEAESAQVFDRIEPFAEGLQQPRSNNKGADVLLKQIGNSLLIQHKIVGRVEIVDKPELLWEYPELGRFYARIEDEYEIQERHLALERKLELVSRTAQTALDIQQQKTGLRLEWYVVILIVIEVFLSLYELIMVDK
ncbi:RMD1 family protein [Oscillatoria sp. CS-180]|uniref:RMD1 family protein n=1 Tax=Oscillatoria sp. CS-180 TaxID=3021720 RepID=UPI00232E21B6|nr:RMD1 family protein [Oscillatoria sp. CS-180]MDB9528104.1 RMD1 family protein [Oscillatoria sp. CS-180]